MKARLFRSGVPKHAPFEFGAQATIGRGEACTVRLEATAVSAEHARIYFDAERGRYFLEDLGSLNGTRLDGVFVTRPEPLERLHVIEFGGQDEAFVFQTLDLSPPAEKAAAAPEIADAGTAADREMPELPASLAEDSAPTSPLEGTSADREMPEVPAGLLDSIDREQGSPEPVDEPGTDAASAPMAAAGGAARYYLRLHEPPGGEPIPLPPGPCVIGRARSADISTESPSVSRRHALLSIGERVTVRDLGSRNQTFVDGRRVEAEVEVAPGSELRFGALVATLLEGEGRE